MTKKYCSIRIICLIWLTGLSAQTLVPERVSYKSSVTDSTHRQVGLRSNTINEIKLQGNQTVWLGTGYGLAKVDQSTLSAISVDTLILSDGTQSILTMGISAIAVLGDKLFASAATDDGTTPVGGGIFYTDDASDSIIIWNYFDQPMDEQYDTLAPFADNFFRALPVTVPNANVTYDASIAGNYAWTASWAGGLRRYDITNNVWDRVPLPEDDQVILNTCDDTSYVDQGGESILKNFYLNPRDPIDGGNHNHKVFSVLAYSDTIWVGTANGINRGILGSAGCIDWEHYSFPLSGLSGNFVVGIARQDWNGRRIIWAATVNADDPSEKRGLSYTINDGETWYTALLGERVYNIAAYDSLVLAASDNGLWKSEDGHTWAVMDPAKDITPLSSDEILSNKVYSVAYDTSDTVLWVGTQDGLGRSIDLHGSNWTIFRADYDSVKTYAYPNPFSPYVHNLMENDGYVRFHTGPIASFVIEMKIYNFALEKVYEENYDRRNGLGTIKWNGRDQNGRLVANGVYFINLNFSEKTNLSPENHWLKLIVVK